MAYQGQVAKLTVMNTWRDHLPAQKATGLLLVLAVFFATVFQLHSHIHSVDAHDSHHQHEHAGSAHLFSVSIEQDHHDDTLVIETKPAGILKKQLDDDILPLLAIFLVALLFLCQSASGRRISIVENSNPYRTRHQHFTPQLRAPPVSL